MVASELSILITLGKNHTELYIHIKQCPHNK